MAHVTSAKGLDGRHVERLGQLDRERADAQPDPGRRERDPRQGDDGEDRHVQGRIGVVVAREERLGDGA